jgi:hypothetical protein
MVMKESRAVMVSISCPLLLSDLTGRMQTAIGGTIIAPKWAVLGGLVCKEGKADPAAQALPAEFWILR